MFDIGCECISKLLISIILGVIVGALYFFGLITGVTIFLWIAFGFAAAVLAIVTIIASLGDKRISRCICRYARCLLLGALLTLILSIIALSITLAATIASAVLIGLIGFAFIFTIILVIELIYCIVNANCRCREE